MHLFFLLEFHLSKLSRNLLLQYNSQKVTFKLSSERFETFLCFIKQMEMTILQECESLPEEKRKHFIKMTDRGKTHYNQ